jgi:tripartite-type tricarboxylate transporter receptor subunit TctC
VDVTRIAAMVPVLTGFLCVQPEELQAQNWPNKRVRIIAPFAAGGAADTLGRIIAEYISSALAFPRPVEVPTKRRARQGWATRDIRLLKR